MSLDEFLAWERGQPQRFEFDGIQPVPMTGGTVAHARLVRKIVEALTRHLPDEYEAFGGDLKVLTKGGRARYPDVLVLPRDADPGAATVAPVLVVEVLSPSTAPTDLSVKPDEYAAVPSILAYVIASPENPADSLVLKKSRSWAAEPIGMSLDLPEIGLSMTLGWLFDRM
jgi:Uma2 family endonuclease